MRLAVSFPRGRCLSDPRPPPRYGLAPFKYRCSPDVLWLYTSTRGQRNPTLAIPPPASQDLGKGWLALRDHSQTLLTHLEHPWELLCQPPAQHRCTGRSGCFLVTQEAHVLLGCPVGHCGELVRAPLLTSRSSHHCWAASWLVGALNRYLHSQKASGPQHLVKGNTNYSIILSLTVTGSESSIKLTLHWI